MTFLIAVLSMHNFMVIIFDGVGHVTCPVTSKIIF